MIYSDWELEILAGIESEEFDPVLESVSLHRFTSYSAGNGRRRKVPVEVAIIKTLRGRSYSWKTFPFDQFAEFLDGDFPHLTEDDFINKLLDGTSEPDR